MTIEQQLRDLARTADDRQPAITADEIQARRSGGFRPAPTSAHTFNGHHDPREDTTMIDLEIGDPAAPASARRRWLAVAGIASAAAAAVVAIALVVVRDDDQPEPADQPPPAPTVTTAAEAAVVPALFEGGDTFLAPGTYLVDEVESIPVTPFTITLANGWMTFDKWAVLKETGLALTFSRPTRVYVDSCHPAEGIQPGPIDDFDAMVASLHGQGGWLDVTPVTTLSIDGYPGASFERSVPPTFDGCEISTIGSDPGGDMFPGWESGGTGEATTGASFYKEGERQIAWVLDLDGTPVVLEARVEQGASPDAAAELRQLLESIRITQPAD